MSVARLLPISMRATQRGERTAAHTVVAALLAGVATARRSLGTPSTRPMTTAMTSTAISPTSASLPVSMRAVLYLVGVSSRAITSQKTCTMMLDNVASRPPEDTAWARSRPCFCRKRIWEAVPPTPGTARLANEVDTCSSVVRTSGRLMGTVPIRARA